MVSYRSVSRRFFLLLLPLMACFLLAVPHIAQAGGVAHTPHTGELPQLQKAKGEKCVKPTEWMRRNHMEFLKHKRDITVREGVRIRSESFKGCQSCHSSREKFCDQCHAYVAVAPNCFECHHYPK